MFEITSGEIRVTDPCCADVLENYKNGTLIATLRKNSYGDED